MNYCSSFADKLVFVRNVYFNKKILYIGSLLTSGFCLGVLDPIHYGYEEVIINLLLYVCTMCLYDCVLLNTSACVSGVVHMTTAYTWRSRNSLKCQSSLPPCLRWGLVIFPLNPSGQLALELLETHPAIHRNAAIINIHIVSYFHVGSGYSNPGPHNVEASTFMNKTTSQTPIAFLWEFYLQLRKYFQLFNLQ